MKKICIFNQKGGVGKTTTVVNTASALGKSGRKVLIIDVDPQGNSTSGLGIEKRNLKNSIYEMLLGLAALSSSGCGRSSGRVTAATVVNL